MRRSAIDWRRFAPLVSLAVVGFVNGATFSCTENESAPPGDDGGALDGASVPGSEDAGMGNGSVVDAIVEATRLSLSVSQVDFSAVNCGAPASTRALTLANTGGSPVTVSAATTGASFSVSPPTMTIGAGSSGELVVTAGVSAGAIAGTPITGSLTLTSNAPEDAPITVPLSVTPSGAVLAFAPGENTTFAFPFTEVSYPGELALVLTNAGNAAVTFTVGPPSDPHFSLAGDAGATLAPGDSWRMSVDFTPTDTSAVYATSTVSATGVVCAPSLGAITYSGSGTTGVISGWPSTVDFGPSDCGGSAPAERTFTLTNAGVADVHIVQVSLTGPPGFSTDAEIGQAIFANGGELYVYVNAPPVPVQSSLAPITATLTIMTDADSSPHVIFLTEEPNGAILAFDTSGSTFGSFGQVPILGSASQAFGVINSGTSAATVTLVPTPSPAFAVSIPTFAIDQGGTQAETATFSPVTGGNTTGTLAMTATGTVCGPLPAPVPLSGASGALPSVSPTSLSFGAICGGTAPAAQSFLVTNGGNGNMSWSMSDVTGAGASLYTVSSSPPPGTLIPGAAATIIVSAAPVASPAPSTDPALFAAQVTITTDVPLDPPHVVTLGETPLGDQLSFTSASPLRFGQVPVAMSLSQGFTVANGANPGSAPATLSFVLEGEGATAYTVVPGAASNLAPGGGVTTGESIVFTPANGTAYSATLGIWTDDPLCSPLPAPIPISGTGSL